ncbi:hypothetical protein BC936DRAFT_140158 [Jimgerdemannia flammicorona]|uniref:PB1 domain-containing protein n=1 Tax=Jimgerdemannia flammicorona TaxID=994334 RepID=A0A433DH73_9FUNG|nr:hypothetical protein BC936DRAFT_140158 [Jimgerdemannia flammicorona]
MLRFICTVAHKKISGGEKPHPDCPEHIPISTQFDTSFDRFYKMLEDEFGGIYHLRYIDPQPYACLMFLQDEHDWAILKKKMTSPAHELVRMHVLCSPTVDDWFRKILQMLLVLAVLLLICYIKDIWN